MKQEKRERKNSMNDDDPKPDFSEDESWFSYELQDAAEAFTSALYEAGCNPNPTEVIVSRTPTGEPVKFETDFGKVIVREVEV